MRNEIKKDKAKIKLIKKKLAYSTGQEISLQGGNNEEDIDGGSENAKGEEIEVPESKEPRNSREQRNTL